MALPRYSVRKVVNPSPSEVDGMTATLTAAFAGEKETDAALGPELAAKINGPLNRGQVTAGALGGGVFYIAEENESKHILGVCLCFGPGKLMLDTLEQQGAALGSWISLIPPEKQLAMGQLMTAFDELKEETLGANTCRNEWYLQRIGVPPSYQGKGIATALIREAMKNNDGLRLSLGTIMPKNVRYYQHLGFEIKGSKVYEDQILLEKVEGFAMLWTPEV